MLRKKVSKVFYEKKQTNKTETNYMSTALYFVITLKKKTSSESIKKATKYG